MSATNLSDLQAGADATMEEKEIIMNLFDACFDYSVLNVNENNLYIDEKYPYDDFRDILIKSDCKKYSALMYIYCRLFAEKEKQSESTTTIKNLESEIESEIQLIKLLLPFFGNSLPDVSIKKGGVIKNTDIIRTIGDLLQKEYYQKGFGYKSLPIEKAKKEIENRIDAKWIDNYMLKKDLGTWIQYEDISPESMMLEEYAKEHLIKIDINESYLISRLSELEQIKKSTKERASSLEKSAEIWRFAEKISYILTFDEFKSQKKCLDIEDFKITDKIRKTIHDCLAFFGLIENKVEIKIKNSTATTTPQKYIYQRLDYYRKSIKDKFEDEKERKTEREINLLRSYLNNEMTRHRQDSELSDKIKFLNYDTFTLE